MGVYPTAGNYEWNKEYTLPFVVSEPLVEVGLEHSWARHEKPVWVLDDF